MEALTLILGIAIFMFILSCSLIVIFAGLVMLINWPNIFGQDSKPDYFIDIEKIRAINTSIETIEPIIKIFNLTIGTQAQMLLDMYKTGAEVLIGVIHTNNRVKVQLTRSKAVFDFEMKVAKYQGILDAYYNYMQEIQMRYEDDTYTIDLAAQIGISALNQALLEEDGLKLVLHQNYAAAIENKIEESN